MLLLKEKKKKKTYLIHSSSFYCNYSCVESTMRTGYELGYNVYTLSDCVAATSKAAQDATLEHNFGMFSIQTNSKEIAEAIKTPAAV